MPTPLPLLGYAVLLATPATPATPAETQPPTDAPALVAHADGSWTITREIAEAPPRLELAADDLLEEVDLAFARPAGIDALEREAEEAFEDAIDAARRDERPE